jgi:hypothetical protein
MMPCTCDECRHHKQLPDGFSWPARRHRCRQIKRISAPAPGIEVPLLDVTAWPSVDFYLDPKGDAQLTGCIVRLYAVAEEIASLETITVVSDPNAPIRLSASGRGCTRWQATIEWPAAALPQSSNQIIVVMVSYDQAGGNGSTLAPGRGGLPAGRALWLAPSAYETSGVISNQPGTLWQFFGTNPDNVPGSATWVLVFDSPTVPGAGFAPTLRVLVPSLAVFSLVLTDPQDPGPPGLPFLTGISWATSSTGDVFTPSAATVAVTAKRS